MFETKRPFRFGLVSLGTGVLTWVVVFVVPSVYILLLPQAMDFVVPHTQEEMEINERFIILQTFGSVLIPGFFAVIACVSGGLAIKNRKSWPPARLVWAVIGVLLGASFLILTSYGILVTPLSTWKNVFN